MGFWHGEVCICYCVQGQWASGTGAMFLESGTPSCLQHPQKITQTALLLTHHTKLISQGFYTNGLELWMLASAPPGPMAFFCSSCLKKTDLTWLHSQAPSPWFPTWVQLGTPRSMVEGGRGPWRPKTPHHEATGCNLYLGSFFLSSDQDS